MADGDDVDEVDTLAEKALRFRLGGASWETIGGRLNIPVNLVSALVADRLLTDPEVAHDIEIRLDLARLDALLVPAYRAGTKGDPKSIDLSLKILARRAELLSELDMSDPSGAQLDQVDGGEDSAPAEPLSPAESLARIRDRAAAGVDGATVLQIVPEVDDDDDE